MRWEDERYVRLYTRDTVDWEMMPWQSRALFPLLLRKVDRAGILQLGKHGARGLANVVGLPVEVTEPGLAGLLDDGSVELHDNTLVIRNFIEAQEAVASDVKRAREYRERHRDDVTNRDGSVTNREQNVTPNHAASRGITARHSVPSVPSRTVPSHSEETLEQAAPPPAPLILIPPGEEKTPARAQRFDFASVYDAFPRKKGRTKGIARLEAMVRTPEAFEQLKLAVKHFAAMHRAEGTELKFIPHFSTWAGTWQDYIEPPQVTPQSFQRNGKPEPTFVKPKHFKKSDIAVGGDS